MRDRRTFARRISSDLVPGDAETRKLVHTYTVGTGVSNQQVGVAYAPSGVLVSLSMSGDLNVFEDQDSDRPSRILSVRAYFPFPLELSARGHGIY